MAYRPALSQASLNNYSEVKHVKNYCNGIGSGDNTSDLQRAIFDAFAAMPSYTNVTIDIGAAAFVNWTSHGLFGNEPVVFTGNVPSPLVAGLAYRPIAATMTANKFQIAKAPGGSAITTSGSTSGVQAAVMTAQYPVSAATTIRGLLLPAGYFITTHPLAFPKSTYGARVQGAGEFATIISNTAGNSTFTTDGFEFSLVSDLNIYATGTSGAGEGVCCFDSNWNGHGQGNNQRNTFRNIRFNGGEYGVRLGWGGSQCDTTSGIDCFFGAHSIAGWSTWNFNALTNSLYGGTFSGCATGALFSSGTGNVYGSTFLGSNSYDIVYAAAAAPGNAAEVCGVRTESLNFIDAHGAAYPISVSGCGQDNGSSGVFVYGSATISLRGCSSLNGQVLTGTGATIDDCKFGRTDWLIGSGAPNNWTASMVSVRDVRDSSNYYSNGFFTGGGGTGMGQYVPNSPYPLPYTVATLPLVASRPPNHLIWVTDAATNVVGTYGFAGGGSHLVLCYNSGSVWVILVAAT